MPEGTLEVLLVGARGLRDEDLLSNMDPYVIITCRTQVQRSSVASEGGSEPEWNETFIFTITEGASRLHLQIMDKDTLSSDDLVGVATIDLEPVFKERIIAPSTYSVVKDHLYLGQIKVGLTFTPEMSDKHRSFNSEESNGGWKELAYRN